ncbi:30S ribosomal protein S10 [Ignicoccus hospitalis]|uniref:Small ribosomal subunit protein uS10 n=1 Tax=Ignicoccus hospitalis (strain KIN4/I / DSM 18386 / JCM 14125) TaxID=453591 RepID=A8A8J7_IGNH4|nr:30S ribosomal protein S10 [Ignicoccus hospitalis]ABU81249.1 SSU ribosomal protein S10P [Ignicoccus hospitalis KIN4/I]HIH90931.1 30S ribosomal protein S10 [Desulfurococcaceae archaeon]
MPPKNMARIKMWSTDVKSIEEVAKQIREIAERSGVEVRGPVPLPVKRLEISTLRLPHGEGTKVFDHWEMRIHKRLIDVELNDKVMRNIMRIRVPSNVYIEIQIKKV